MAIYISVPLPFPFVIFLYPILWSLQCILSQVSSSCLGGFLKHEICTCLTDQSQRPDNLPGKWNLCALRSRSAKTLEFGPPHNVRSQFSEVSQVQTVLDDAMTSYTHQPRSGSTPSINDCASMNLLAPDDFFLWSLCWFFFPSQIHLLDTSSYFMFVTLYRRC